MKTDIDKTVDWKTDTSKTARIWIATSTKEDCLRLQETYSAMGFKVLRSAKWSWLKMRYTAKLSRQNAEVSDR